MHKSIDPISESKSDYEIFSAIADKLKISSKFTENRNEDQWLRFL